MFLKKKLTIRKLIYKIVSFFQFFLFNTKLKIYVFSIFKKLRLINIDNFKKPIFLYDLRDNPLTFDFGDDLLLTNLWLKKFGFQSCECIIFANKEEFVPMKYRSYNLLFSKNELWKRVDNILKPLSEAANFITKTKIVSDKNELKKILQESFLVYPPYYLSFEKYNMVFNGIPYNRINNLIRDKKQFYPVANYYEPNANVIKSVKESLKITNKEKLSLLQ